MPGHRASLVLAVAGATGLLVGLVVAGFERLTAEVLLRRVVDLPRPAAAAAPAAGLLLGLGARRWLARGASPATADEYVRNFHEPGHPLDLRPVPGRLVAAVATLGLGGPLGYEGPALYAGCAVGAALQRRLRRVVTEPKVLLVAGAAAGVAAVFKAPVTGLVFALEVPYTDDLARRMLLPAAVASAVSYVTFALLVGTAPLLPVAGRPQFDARDLGGAALVGLAAGVAARVFAAAVKAAKRAEAGGRPLARALAAGATLAVLYVAGRAALGTNPTLGPGYDALRWALDPRQAVWAVLLLAVLRFTATGVSLAGGGTGGLFVPLVVQGALLGRAMAGLLGGATRTLLPMVGVAAFLGAGYRVPLAAVVFVAEATGRPGFVVPGMIAAVVAQLAVGGASVSAYQRGRRAGPLEERLHLPLSVVLDAEVRTAPPDATIEELFWQHVLGGRQSAVPVVDGAGSYVGLVSVEDLAALPRERWATTLVADVVRTDLPVAQPSWRIVEALRAMDDAGVDVLAVCDGGRRLTGVVRAADIWQLGDVLDRLEP